MAAAWSSSLGEGTRCAVCGISRHSTHVPCFAIKMWGISTQCTSITPGSTMHRPSGLPRLSARDILQTQGITLELQRLPLTHSHSGCSTSHPWKAVPALVVSARPPAANPVPKRQSATISIVNCGSTDLLSQARRYLSALLDHRKRRIVTRASQDYPYRSYR
jgi:hypothetical protein